MKMTKISSIYYFQWMLLEVTESTSFCFVSEIGDIAGVADVTIRQSYRLIYTRADQLFPSDFKFATPIDKLPNV